MIEPDVKLAFVQPSHGHVRKVGQGIRIDHVRLRIKPHHCQACGIDERIDGWIEHGTGNFVARRAAALDSKGSGNYSGYKNAAVDAALDAARATTDVAERTRQYNIAMEQAATDLPEWRHVVSAKLMLPIRNAGRRNTGISSFSGTRQTHTGFGRPLRGNQFVQRDSGVSRIMA